MKIISSVTLFVFILLNSTSQQDYSALRSTAETFYEQGSYARANQIYSQVDKTKLLPAEVRWVDFRLADTSWRSQAATQTSDPTIFNVAQHQLEELIRTKDKESDRDLVWAEAHESLGDFFWTRRNQMNWGSAWPHYEQSLDWWSGQSDLTRARSRYLKIIFKAAEPPTADQYYFYTYYGNYIPLNILENALKISSAENERTHLHFLIAMTMRNSSGDMETRQRIPDEFEEALKGGKQNNWYDDALFYYAEWMNSSGGVRQSQDGEWQQEPDYVTALELFKRLTTEFTKGETRYFDQAQQQIKQITEPTIAISTSNTFLPGSELQFNLNARNLKHVEISIYKIDLVRDVHFTKGGAEDEGEAEDSAWLNRVALEGRVAVKSWTKDLPGAATHKQFSEESRVDGQLPTGAYLIEAKAGSLKSRDLLLITDVAVVVKSSAKQALVYFSNALSGAPLANATVSLWENYYASPDGKWHWRHYTKLTNTDGLAPFDLSSDTNSRSLFISAVSNARQALSTAYTGSADGGGDPWRIYAFTDRPAYRPKETVQWKFIARRSTSGGYTTPANQVIEYEVTDPRSERVAQGKSTLNSFGSAWGSIQLGQAFALGEYTVQFWDEGRHNEIGRATLFRVEEYKLPEFKVQVQTPEQNGRKKAFRLGENVEVNIQADYYFGGPVANATVEVIVYQRPFYHYWHPRRDYAWLYDDEQTFDRYYGRQGQVVKRETIHTDASGKAVLSFETPRANYNQDFEYQIEARVTDSSRREIRASDTVRVTRYRYYVYPNPEKNIYRPKDRVAIEIKALDANEQPVKTEGTVHVTRDYWWEVWLDPNGREIKGEELHLLRERNRVFPPASSGKWQLKFRGYQHEEVVTERVATDAEGTAQFTFVPQKDGYYRISWQSSQGIDPKRDRFLPPVKAEASVFVATNATTELGYRYDGVQLVVDKDTFRAGQIAPVTISVPVSDRYVLFTVEGDELYSYQLVHVTGTAKLIELPVDDRYIPNIYLSAAMVNDSSLSLDTKPVVVPPLQQFLNVEVKSDREQYEPRQEGTLTVSVKDMNDKPVAAELALGLIDESVKYIQRDYAGDPRQFYYGNKRSQSVQTQSSFNQKSYAKLVQAGQSLREEREVSADLLSKREAKDANAASPAPPVAAEREAASLAQLSESAVNTAVDGAAKMKAARRSPAATSAPEPAVQVRTDFRSTILWLPDIKTDADGRASVKVTYPDSLTTWSATARAASSGNQFGIGTAATRTKQPLIVRLQSPRFFVVGDDVIISAVINNNTGETLRVVPRLMAQGLTVKGVLIDGQTIKADPEAVEVKSEGEVRVDWLVAATGAGEAKLRVEARTDKYADAMENSFTVYEHGIEKYIARSGKMRSDSVSITLELPKERRPESTSLMVQVSPSLATTMLDALPYLIDYPYGCTEQTMSRFLPAVITVKTLRDLGIKPEAAMSHVFGGIEAASASATHPKGKHDLAELDSMTKDGLERLYNFQHDDGGWGWWKEGDSDHFMTAYVVWGMSLARDAGVEIKGDSLQRAVSYLEKELVEEELNPDEQAWMLHALSEFHRIEKKPEVGKFEATAFNNLWAKRDKLNAYTRALLALSANNFGYRDKAQVLVQNLENGVTIDNHPDTSVVQPGAQSTDASVMGTAHWGEDGFYWRWSDGGVEATSFALRAILAIDPNNKLIEPVTNWLIKNRRGAQWSNTRDTAIALLTLNDYLRTSGELQTSLTYELAVNGSVVATKQVSPADVLSLPTTFDLSRELLRDGRNEISIRRTTGSGPLYFSAAAKFFSLEEPVSSAGHEIFVRRQYFKLVNRQTLLKGYVSERIPLNDGETVKSGERIEVVLTVEAKNNYEYLLFEDLKPAGLEAVELRSGQNVYIRELKSGARAARDPSGDDFTGRTRWVYQELRDRKVALFIDHLPEGVWQMSYEMRAETPGSFHALPVLGQAMYVPEIRTNSSELRLKVVD